MLQLDKINEWYKKNPDGKVWWLDVGDDILGVWIFSFDKKKRYDLWADYPYKLTKEEKEIFDKENPFWADFFKD